MFRLNSLIRYSTVPWILILFCWLNSHAGVDHGQYLKWAEAAVGSDVYALANEKGITSTTGIPFSPWSLLQSWMNHQWANSKFLCHRTGTLSQTGPCCLTPKQWKIQQQVLRKAAHCKEQRITWRFSLVSSSCRPLRQWSQICKFSSDPRLLSDRWSWISQSSHVSRRHGK